MSDAFARFIETVDPIVRRPRDFPEIVSVVELQVRSLVHNRDWLEPKFRQPILEKAYAQYLLYRPPDYAYSVVSFVWNPRQGSPIHDHCTWGVIGQYEGEEEESRFRKNADGSIERIATATARPGDVAHVFPPHRDIHQIVNRTPTPTISIHIYGGDIGSRPRHAYDPATGKITRFVSGYDAHQAPLYRV